MVLVGITSYSCERSKDEGSTIVAEVHVTATVIRAEVHYYPPVIVDCTLNVTVWGTSVFISIVVHG